MVTIVLTPKISEHGRVFDASARSTTSSSFVDVTGITLQLPDKMLAMSVVWIKTNSAGTTWYTGIDIDGIVSNIKSAPGTAQTLNSLGPAGNNTGAIVTAKLVFRAVGGNTATIRGCSIVYAPFSNLSDLQIKASVQKVFLLGNESVVSLLGASTKIIAVDEDSGWVEIDVDALIDGGFIFSANDGLVLMDFIGDKIGLSA